MFCTYLSKSEGLKSPLPENTSGMNTTEAEVEYTEQKVTSVYDRGFLTVVRVFLGTIRGSPETSRTK
jgi:hypothetical protein